MVFFIFVNKTIVLFQKRVVRTKFDIYIFTSLANYCPVLRKTFYFYCYHNCVFSLKDSVDRNQQE
jgi:hypothetical protein